MNDRRPRHRTVAAAALLVVLGLLAACGGGGGPTTPLLGANAPPELVLCQIRPDNLRQSRILLRTAQNLGLGRVSDRSGQELHVRVHPDGMRLIYARQREAGREDSRELFTSLRDNSERELRLTVNGAIDDGPVWSPDGSAVLFSSDRGGERRLWRMAADGSDPREFLAGPPGSADRDPDWHAGTDRIVFSRAEAGGPFRLWLVQGDGTGLTPLTDGGAAAAGFGDLQPAFSPGGGEVVFVRRSAADRAVLMAVDTAGSARLLHDPDGDAALPRWSPHGDRLFAALSRPNEGMPGRRLYQLLADGTGQALVIPDARFEYEGIDVLPALPALAAAEPMPATVDLTLAELQLAAGSAVSGDHRQLLARDGDDLRIRTTSFGSRQIAGLNLVLPLPVAEPTDILQLRIEVRAALSRSDQDSFLRLAVHNPVENRADTVVELAPAGTAPSELAFSLASLAHVSREREFRLEVIGDLSDGTAAVLAIDYVGVQVQVRRAP